MIAAIRRRAPLGLVGMLVLVFVAESRLAKLDLELTPVWALDWRRAGASARREAPRAEILCFGDSLAKLGLVPQVIEAGTGRGTLSLALSVGQVPASYFLLRRAIEAGARPKAIVIDTIPHLLAEGPDYNERLYADLLTTREALELGIAARDGSLFARLALASGLPSIRCRYELRSFVANRLAGRPASQWTIVAAHWRNWRANRGAQPAAKQPDFHGDAARWPAELYPATWAPHSVNAEFLDRFLDLAASRAIPVYWLVPPFSPEVQSRREGLGLDDAFTDFLERTAGPRANLTVVDGRRSAYGTAVHHDPIHLDREGAVRLSTDLAAVVANGLARPGSRPRRIDLPTYRDPPPGWDVEDLDQSLAAVIDRAARARR